MLSSVAVWVSLWALCGRAEIGDGSTCGADGACSEEEQLLAAARQLYQWKHSHEYDPETVLEPIAMLLVDDDHPLPREDNLRLVQVVDLVITVADILVNNVVKLTNLIGVGKVPDYEQQRRDEVNAEVQEQVDLLYQDISKLMRVADLAIDIESKGGDRAAPPRVIDAMKEAISQAFQNVLQLFKQLAARMAGLSGRPQAISDYADLFQTFTVPDMAGAYSDDLSFAYMRVAGPNPTVLVQQPTVPDAAKFPVDAARYALVMEGDSLDTAAQEGRLFIADYAVLSVLEPGSLPALKFPTAPLALFAVPPASAADRRLRPVAIQCGQAPAEDTPVLYPDDGERWRLAKLHVSAADGNHHELIAHLGLTHLLIETFAVATHRQLPTNHPLFKLLIPHFQGTFFINSLAVTSLINPGGTVDQLLAGTIETDWQVVIDALGGVDFSSLAVPASLEARGVADATQLPVFPYRDDALLVWDAVREWVAAYVALYYGDDASVAGDAQLQAMIAEVISEAGIQGLGENGGTGVATVEYLVDTIATVIFTASAQHAAVNFPQASIMAYTPLMPLAAFGPPPGESVTTESELDQLPPLENAVLQLLTAKQLGGIYFTRLGQYDRHQSVLQPKYFTDPRVEEALVAFRSKLDDVELEISLRNLNRPKYDVLLPSRIPQSINI